MSSTNGQTRREPFVLPTADSGRRITSLQPTYTLSEADFLRLQSAESKVNNIAGWLLSGWLGYVISVMPKLTFKDGSLDYSGLSTGEIATAVIIFVAGILLFGLGALLPNEKRSATKKIKKYFDDYQVPQMPQDPQGNP